MAETARFPYFCRRKWNEPKYLICHETHSVTRPGRRPRMRRLRIGILRRQRFDESQDPADGGRAAGRAGDRRAAGFGRLARRQDRHDRGRLHPYVQARRAQDFPHGQRRHADRSCRERRAGQLRSAVREPYRARHGYARRTARGRGLPRGLGGADEGADRRPARHDRGRLRRREGRTAGDGRHRRGAHCRLPREDRRPQGRRGQGLPLVLLRDGDLV